MSDRHVIDASHVDTIREVLMDVEQAMKELDADGCDASDVQEVIDKASAELETPQPNATTLSTYLNSIARSLRNEPRAKTVVLELDAAMRDAKVPTNWEH